MSKSYVFSSKEGSYCERNKLYYPNHLHVYFENEADALEAAESIIRQVKDKQGDIGIFLFGKLEEDDET